MKSRPTDLLTPKRSPIPTVHYIHVVALHRQGSSWGLPFLTVTSKGSRMLVMGRSLIEDSCQPSDAMI